MFVLIVVNKHNMKWKLTEEEMVGDRGWGVLGEKGLQIWGLSAFQISLFYFRSQVTMTLGDWVLAAASECQINLQ